FVTDLRASGAPLCGVCVLGWDPPEPPYFPTWPVAWRSRDGGSFEWLSDLDAGANGAYPLAGGLPEVGIRAIACFDDENTWAVGDYGTIEHWTGKTWHPSSTQPYDDRVLGALRALWRTDSGRIWAFGDDTALFREPGARDKERP